MYCGGTNQETKLQWSSKIGREKQEECDKATLHIRIVCKKKDLISSKDRSHPPKHLAFLLLQIHHIKQCSTSLQKSILRCLLNLPCQDSNNSITLWGITQWSPNKQNSKDHSSNAMEPIAKKQKIIHQLPTPLTHVTPIKLSPVRILPQAVVHPSCSPIKKKKLAKGP